MRNKLNINLSIGAGCFVQCSGCYNHFGKGFLPQDVILKFLSYMRQNGATRVTIAGGDPLTYPDIIGLCERIKALGYSISLDTVGTPLLETENSIFYKKVTVNKIDVKQLVKFVDLIGIALDGDDDETIATFRTKRPNLFKEQMEILSLLQENKANICINTLVHQQNISKLVNLPEITKDITQISNWQFFQFMPVGVLGYRNRKKYMIDETEFQSFKKKFITANGPLGKKIRFEFKGNGSRKGNYCLIDSDGLVWVPAVSYSESWDNDRDATSDRFIIGDIKNVNDYGRIKSFIFSPQVHLGHLKTVVEPEPAIQPSFGE